MNPPDYLGGGAEYFAKLLDATKKNAAGEREDFQNPPVVRPISEDSRLDLVVDYANNRVMACDVRLRSYNGGLVGPTIRARPGQTLHIRLINRLPTGRNDDPHPQDPPPGDHAHHFSFNITNLHTHGLNTSPRGDKAPGFSSDNVLLEVHPGEIQDYRIHIHDKHPTGTFWYHAHVHGATALQVASGMAGALIVEGGTDGNGGLDSVPEIAAADEKIFVLQQLSYLKKYCPPDFGDIACLDDFRNVGAERSIQRPITVNGQFVPAIRMRPGEVQRWRFIHAGTTEVVQPVVDGHKLYEIAVDGLALGRMVAWPAKNADPNTPTMVLAPGNRSDVVIKAGSAGEYALQALPPAAQVSLRLARAAIASDKTVQQLTASERLDILGDQPEIIAKVVVAGPPLDMALPSAQALASRVPFDLVPIRDDELTDTPQQLRFLNARSKCDKFSGECAPCPKPCVFKLMISVSAGEQHIFMPNMKPITLKLGQASEWSLAGTGFAHPFHIHVNPFQVRRDEPDRSGGWLPDDARPWVWKDTVQLFNAESEDKLEYITVRSRYTRFTGRFVLHCHILGHEDSGMMQLVEVRN